MKIHFYCLLFCTLFFMNDLLAQNKYNANDPSIKYIGRTLVNEDGSVSFNWSGTSLETYFSGNFFAVKIINEGISYCNVFVDGKFHKKIEMTSSTDTLIRVSTTLSNKRHRIQIQKCTEGEFGKMTICYILLSKKGQLYPVNIPKGQHRHIEFIGDSFTCGYGVEGKNRDEPFKVETENCGKTYAAMIARYYGADYTVIAHSGRGVVHNYGDSVRVSATSMTKLMMNTFDNIDSPKWKVSYVPNLVVINLGLNDFGLEPHPYREDFKKAYKTLLSQVRALYGTIPVLCIYPTIQFSVCSYYKEAIAEMNDPNIYFLQIKKDLCNKTTDLGAAWHPGYSGQLKMAMWMIPYISTIMNWNMDTSFMQNW